MSPDRQGKGSVTFPLSGAPIAGRSSARRDASPHIAGGEVRVGEVWGQAQ